MKNYNKVILGYSIILTTLFMGLIFAAGTVIIWRQNVGFFAASVFPIVLAGIQFLITPAIIDMMYDVMFYEETLLLKEEVVDFIKNTCKEMKIPVPKLGVICDGNPNAFTYGHIPKDARLVLTSGLIDILTEEELKAVIAHELGHIKHYDFILMMLVSVIPMIFYQIYLRTKDNKANAAYIFGLGAYGVYVLSGFLVLSFSRIREYYADNFAKGIMKDAKQLRNALIKIAYGTASREKYKTPRISTMGFTNNIQNETFMISSFKSPENEKLDKKLMRWDLKNLWGRWYEINSTHPLTAKRIFALTDEVIEDNKPEPADIFKFLLEAAVRVLPWVTFVAILALAHWESIFDFNIIRGLENTFMDKPIYVALLGGSILLRYYYSYKGNYEAKSIYELLGSEDASPVKGKPTILEGKIIGRGIPGLFYSEDLVIDDGTGIMFIDYKQPFRILEFLFGTFKVDKILESKVKVIGWYKRGTRPYFVCKHILLGERKIISYNYILTELFGYLLIAAGIIVAVI